MHPDYVQKVLMVLENFAGKTHKAYLQSLASASLRIPSCAAIIVSQTDKLKPLYGQRDSLCPTVAHGLNLSVGQMLTHSFFR